MPRPDPYSGAALNQIIVELHAVLQCCQLSGGVDLSDQGATVNYIREIADATEAGAYSFSILYHQVARTLAALPPKRFNTITTTLRKRNA
jgi:hypothetical protein